MVSETFLKILKYECRQEKMFSRFKIQGNQEDTDFVIRFVKNSVSVWKMIYLF
jgi:hypothetical protein